MSIVRTPLVDDDGTGNTGTPIDNAWQTTLYNAIDAAVAASGGGVTLPISLTTQVTGTLQAAQEPAHSGDVTNAAGSLALAIGALKVTSAMLAGSIPWSKLIQTDVSLKAKQITNAPVPLTDGASVALDVTERALYYRLVAVGDRTMAAPSGSLVDGQKLVIQHVASGAARTLTLTTGSGGFRFGTDITALTQTASGKTDYIGAIYSFPDNRWDVVAYTKGF